MRDDKTDAQIEKIVNQANGMIGALFHEIDRAFLYRLDTPELQRTVRNCLVTMAHELLEYSERVEKADSLTANDGESTPF